jgi:hypothetical protein
LIFDFNNGISRPSCQATYSLKTVGGCESPFKRQKPSRRDSTLCRRVVREVLVDSVPRCILPERAGRRSSESDDGDNRNGTECQDGQCDDGDSAGCLYERALRSEWVRLPVCRPLRFRGRDRRPRSWARSPKARRRSRPHGARPRNRRWLEGPLCCWGAAGAQWGF